VERQAADAGRGDEQEGALPHQGRGEQGHRDHVANQRQPRLGELVPRGRSAVQGLAHFPYNLRHSPPSCPRLSRASTPFWDQNKAWMAGTSPATTNIA